MKKPISMVGSPLADLATLRDARSKRESSFDRTGGNGDWIVVEPGKRVVIADIKGAGCIRHIWFTMASDDPRYLRKYLLRMFWDGEKNPSVEVPVGDFFGVGHGVANHFVSLPLNMTRGPGRDIRAGMNCYFPMPYAKSARIEMENQCVETVHHFYYIDYEEYDALPEDQGRFHAWWNCENPTKAVRLRGGLNTTGDENYLILDAKGRGHYVGCVLSIDNINPPTAGHGWYGEGDDMIFIDGEKWPPSLHGTGTEDYFCEAWGFPSGEYAGPYHGVSLAGGIQDWTGKWSLYRFHIEDAVHFQKSIRVSIEHGHANNLANDYSSVAYWYQTEPHKKFPKLRVAPKRKRSPR